MTLQQYTDTFWFPDGSVAANVNASVFPKGSSALAQLWTSSAGTVALPNPLPTSGAGVLTFWAESGDYWVHINAETIPVALGMSQEQADLSTGIASGGDISASATPASVDISAVDGYIVNYLAGNQSEPVITRIKLPAQTVAMDAGSLARTTTWWLLNSSGAVIQQASKPDATQRRTHIMLGVTAQVGGVIVVDQSLPVILPGQANQLVDLMDALGPFNMSGNLITPNGTNLMINHSSGQIFSRAFHHYAGAALTNDPHISTTITQTPADFIYITQTTTVAPVLTNLIDVANFDSGGTVTPIGGGAGTSSIHRIYLFPNNDPQRQLIIQYGQNTYSSLTAAVDAIGAGTFVENPSFIQGGGALIAYIAATRTATNLSDPAQATFVRAGKFAAP